MYFSRKKLAFSKETLFFNEVESRCTIWQELESLNANTPVSSHPWEVIGDFNQIIRTTIEAQAKGLTFSWWNNQDANPISKKIDHALINQSWAQHFSEGYTELLEPDQYVHAPILFHLPFVRRRAPKPFKFFNHSIDHPLFVETLRSAWQPETIVGTYQFKMVRSLKLLKKDLRGINKQHFNLQRRLLTQPDSETASLEHEARAQWHTLSKAEAKFYHQRSRVQMITSVIYKKVNFWSVVFNLPKSFYAKIDSLCSAFLWKNKSSSSQGARISWKDICIPKKEGGLGIRLLEEFEMVFRLKQVWNLFSNPQSLWVSWLRGNVFYRKPLWLMEESPRLSRAVRSMIQTKDLLLEFLICEVRNGQIALFWYDSWSDMGPLINFVGASGPCQLSLRQTAVVADAITNGECGSFQVHLTTISPPSQASGNDKYLWIQVNGTFGSSFSSRVTWEHIRQPSPVQPWSEVIWFKQHIPRNSFISWIALLRHLQTRDRLRRWGMTVPQDCVLCSAAAETHHHLFFEYNFSMEVWNFFASRIWPNPPQDLHSAAAWIILNQSSPPKARCIIKLIFQSSIYLIWKERKRRIFNSQVSPPL
ncbi:hypothetical protein Bca52824_017340 [Brassica carinata]|uniref:Reverse transcriptase zinc-binding domain-containing protein n=1 Tax=Brassica carinata TaxID=52824 RepID=A0A8X7VNF6_BRACI|nr:hypothetical protein Bca52824_017340 [Brassica carinata]